MQICSCNFNIEYNDVDEKRLITPRGFLRFLQEAASIASQKTGYGINDIQRTNMAWILLNWKVEIYNKPIWNSKIKINTWAKYNDNLYSYRDFEIYDETNNIIALATSKWIILNPKTHKIVKISDKLKKGYDYKNKSVFDETFKTKFIEPIKYDSIMAYNIQRRDIDSNKHVNNLCYLDFALQALPEDIYNEYNKISNIEISYKKELILGDKINICYKQLNEDEYIVVIKNKDLSLIHSVIKMEIK